MTSVPGWALGEGKAMATSGAGGVAVVLRMGVCMWAWLLVPRDMGCSREDWAGGGQEVGRRVGLL